MIFVAVFGFIISMYVPYQFFTAPAEVIGSSYWPAFAITLVTTFFGVIFGVLGSLVAIKSFNENYGLLMSHLEAAIFFILISAVSIIGYFAIDKIFEEHRRLDMETQMLQQQINYQGNDLR